jgi:hypothetical protein
MYKVSDKDKDKDRIIENFVGQFSNYYNFILQKINKFYKQSLGFY